jgi:beta-glucanase (GH16 family)
MLGTMAGASLFTVLATRTSVQSVEKAKMKLIWADECNRANGTAPFGWDVRVTDQWQNSTELQRYTTSIDNAHYDGQGHLVLQALKNGDSQLPYTSAKLAVPRDIGNGLILGGMVEARIRVPTAQGIWPAFWMLGQDNVYGWPACGEIDIMEAPASVVTANQVHQGTHSPSSSNSDVKVGVPFSTIANLGASFHTYSMRWEKGLIDFYVDSIHTGGVTEAMVSAAGGLWPFDHKPQSILLNLAVGGWAGNPDPAWLNQVMLVDYVRVYG